MGREEAICKKIVMMKQRAKSKKLIELIVYCPINRFIDSVIPAKAGIQRNQGLDSASSAE